MPDAHSRRGFLRSVLGGAAREVAGPPPARRPDRKPLGRPWAAPAARFCTQQQLEGLVAEHGLEKRRDDVLALARVSYRLLGDPDGRHPRASDVSAIVDVPAFDGALVIDARIPVGDSAAPARAQAAPGSQPPVSTIGVENVEPTAELVLPRAWSAPVEEIGLGAAEQERWSELRDALAALQGVEPPETTVLAHRLHRLFGYPDDSSGTLAIACELHARGRPDEPDLTGPDRAELELAAARWTFVLQLSCDVPGGDERVTVWAPRERFAAGDLGGLVAIRRPMAVR